LSETDFAEALGKLLTDGPLRDAFARDPAGTAASLSHDRAVQSELVSLRMEDLEYQAGVLLRKRFDAAKRLLPALFTRLGGEAWPIFRAYGRKRWLQGNEDALAFADEIHRQSPDFLQAREMNRLRFTQVARRWRVHGIRLDRFRPALQVLYRRKSGTWRERVFFLRF